MFVRTMDLEQVPSSYQQCKINILGQTVAEDIKKEVSKALFSFPVLITMQMWGRETRYRAIVEHLCF